MCVLEYLYPIETVGPVRADAYKCDSVGTGLEAYEAIASFVRSGSLNAEFLSFRRNDGEVELVERRSISGYELEGDANEDYDIFSVFGTVEGRKCCFSFHKITKSDYIFVILVDEPVDVAKIIPVFNGSRLAPAPKETV